MNVDQLISELILLEDREQEVQILLPDGSTAPIKDIVGFKPPHDDFPAHTVTLIRPGNL